MKSSSRASNFVLGLVANSACSQPELTPALLTSTRTTCSTICRVTFLHGRRATSPSPRATRPPAPQMQMLEPPLLTRRSLFASCLPSLAPAARARARPPWPAGRACCRRIPAAFEPPLCLLCTVVSSPVCTAPFRLRRPAVAALGSPPACCAAAAARSQVAKPRPPGVWPASSMLPRPSATAGVASSGQNGEIPTTSVFKTPSRTSRSNSTKGEGLSAEPVTHVNSAVRTCL